MSRYIDADKLDKKFNEILDNPEEYDKPIHDMLREFYFAPTEDVEPVRHAYDMDEYTSLFECSSCGWTCDDTYGGEPCVGNTVTYNYCPNCGAKIDYKIGYGEHIDGESNE